MSRKIVIKADKAKVVAAIHELLQKGNAGTQEDIRHALHKQGMAVNQVMISRLLHKLGAVKMKEGNRIVYRLPIELSLVSPENSINQLVLSIVHNETLIVIHTSPGSAQLVARLVDQNKHVGVLGTVAGDDTILIVPESVKEIKNLYHVLSRILYK